MAPPAPLGDRRLAGRLAAASLAARAGSTDKTSEALPLVPNELGQA